ncbi:MAG: WD40/YVTN/BNR-like repeat-containing protein [Ferruginibacter sp.]
MKKFILSITTLLTVLSLQAQKDKNTIAKTDSIIFSNVKYRQVGPFRGGRSGTVAGSFKNKNTFIFGATGGGVWKTTDGGSNWKNISDKYFGGSIGAVAIAQSDESILYAGEGENTLRGNVSEGLNGMWRSDDGGRTWKLLSLKNTRHISRIIIHPKNPDIVWVAAIGHLFGSSDDRGVYKTMDGGKTWRKVLFANANAGAVELVMEPGNPSTLYASTWHVKRTPYSFESGGLGSGLWKSTDAGETWTNLMDKKGMPKKELIGNIGIAVSAVNPERIYALIECKSRGLYRSDDGGNTWEKQTDDANICQRAWYFSKIFADTKSENIVYALNVGMYISTDAGKTFKPINTPHGDHHDLWIDPEDANRMIVADDGGAQVTFDAGNNWSTYQNQPTAQFYRVSTDNHFPYRILAAQQDNSTVRILSSSNGGQISTDDWSPTAGAESGYVVADPLNPDIVYGGNYGGYLSRLDHKTGENRAISVYPDNPLGAGASSTKYRFQWNFPIFFSPHNPKKLYAGGQHLFSTENEGQSWEVISPDLTTNDTLKQKSSGGPITQDNTSVEYYCTIFAAIESPYEKDLLWAGSDDGRVNVSKDGGKNWSDVTPPAAGKLMMWNCIDADPFKKGAAYIVGTKYKMDDFKPYIFKTEDYGKTWKEITTGIPSMYFARAIRADKKRAGLLYAGTEYGMYISYNDGANWRPFQLNLPWVPITDMTIKNNDLIVATQGRALWVVDDLITIQQYDETILDKNLFILPINESYRRDGFVNVNVKNAGTNATNGSIINFFVKEINDSSKAVIVLMDKNKKEIKRFTTDAKEKNEKIELVKGMNSFVWNMNYPEAEKIEGMILWNGAVGSPKAIPGGYYVKVKVDKDSMERPFTILPNLAYNITQQGYEEQFTTLVSIRDKFTEIQKAIKSIRDVRSQINDFADRNSKDLPKDIKQKGDTINKQLTTIEEALYQTKAKSGQDVLNYPIRLNDKISGLFDYASSGYNPPTMQVKQAYNDLAALADIQLNKLKNLMEIDVVELNKMIREKAIPIIGVKKAL